MALDSGSTPVDGCGFVLFFYSGALLVCSTCLLSSSSWALQNSCSIEQSSSLNNPTSSQFFKKRVGVGVWSGSKTTTTTIIGKLLLLLGYLCTKRKKKN